MRARELRKTSPDAERAIWNAVRNRQLGGYKFRRQHPVARYFADFACVEAQLIVELDGGQHFEAEVIEADRRRTAELNRAGFEVLRFTDREALMERDGVLTRILDWLHIHHPHLQCAPRLASRGRSAGSAHAPRKPPLSPNPLPQAGEGVNTKD